MRKALLYTLSFILILFILDRAWQFLLLQNLNLKTTYITKDNIHADLVFLGPCTSLWMMEPDSIEKYTGKKAYNLSTGNSNLAENYAMLHLYLQHNKAPKTLYLALNHESFDKSINLFNTWQFAHLAGDSVIRNIIREEDMIFNTCSSIPFMRFALYNRYTSFFAVQGLKHYLGKKETSYHPDGFELPVNNSWDGSFEKFKEEFPNGKKYSWDTVPELYCRKIIRMAQSKGVRVILYDSPVYKAASPCYLNREEIIRKTSVLAREEGTEYLQFEIPELTKEKRYFITPINTTREGSAVFMRRFINKTTP